MCIGGQHQRLPAEVALHRRLAQLGHLRTHQRRRQFAGQLEQRLRAALPAGRDARLETQAGRQLARQQTDRQHHDKGDHVLHVADRKRQARRDKKIVKRRHIEESRQRRRATPEFQGNPDGAEQKQHDDVGQIEETQQRRGQRGDGDAGGDGPEVGRQAAQP